MHRASHHRSISFRKDRQQKQMPGNPLRCTTCRRVETPLATSLRTDKDNSLGAYTHPPSAKGARTQYRIVVVRSCQSASPSPPNSLVDPLQNTCLTTLRLPDPQKLRVGPQVLGRHCFDVKPVTCLGHHGRQRSSHKRPKRFSFRCHFC